MIQFDSAFSGFSVDSLPAAQKFYTEVLGLKVTSAGSGLHLHLPKANVPVFIYPKGEAHEPAEFTVLNFRVENIDNAVESLKANGVAFENYEFTDEKGIARGLSHNAGPDIAWFKDPSGNILSVLQETA